MGGCVEHISTDGPRNCRSLHFATPDFLLDLVALLQFMRPSLRKGAYAALSSAAWQEIRVRSGRDDKGECGAFRGDSFVDEGNSRSLRSGPTAGRDRRDDNFVWERQVSFPR